MPRKIPLADRLWAMVDRSGGPDACWPFTGTRRDGYGRIKDEAGRLINANRAAYQVHHGVTLLPEELALHSCDNPPCCNPGHLFKGDDQANADDKMAKGRHRWRGSPGQTNGMAILTDDQVREIVPLFETMTTVAIAERYGVARPTISFIRSGRNWSGITGIAPRKRKV